MGSIKLGVQELDDRPMNLHEAIMFLFIIKPYVPSILYGMQQSPLDMVINLLDAIKDNEPKDIAHLFAMMYHVSSDTFVDKTIQSEELILALLSGFEKNQVFEILKAGLRLGVI